MTNPVDLILYIAVASLALLPAVYAVALEATRPHAASLRMKEAILTAEYGELLEDSATAVATSDESALQALHQSLQSYKERLAAVRQPAIHIAPSRALILPATLWALSIITGGVGRFATTYPSRISILLPLAALSLLVWGYVQVIMTLVTAHRAIEESLPKLEIAVTGPFETRDSKGGEARYTMKYDIAVVNNSTHTARGVQVAVGVPASGLYFPVLKPMVVTRGGRSVRIGFTPQFDLKPQDTYKQFLMLCPQGVGKYRLTFTPLCDDLIGAAKTVTLQVNKL